MQNVVLGLLLQLITLTLKLGLCMDTYCILVSVIYCIIIDITCYYMLLHIL